MLDRLKRRRSGRRPDFERIALPSGAAFLGEKDPVPAVDDLLFEPAIG